MKALQKELMLADLLASDSVFLWVEKLADVLVVKRVVKKVEK